jgi:uncharacterized protein YciI
VDIDDGITAGAGPRLCDRRGRVPAAGFEGDGDVKRSSGENTMRTPKALALSLWLALAAGTCQGQPANPGPPPAYDPALAQATGADERGMRSYVLVVLKTGPNRIPVGPERDEMFKGHFANIKRLEGEGKLVLAGPFEGGDDGWRGLFVFAVADIEEAKRLVATDPVVAKGEMVAEFHKYYGTAALTLLRDLDPRLARQPL